MSAGGGRRPLPNSGHVVADGDGRAHDHAAAGRDDAEAWVGHVALLRRGARHPQREGGGNPGRGRRVRAAHKAPGTRTLKH